jgi:hypothetical protein
VLLASGRYLQFPNSLIRTTAGQLPVEIVRLQMRLTSPPLGLIRIKDRDPSPATRIFMEHLRRAATTLRADARHLKTPSRRKSAEPTSV